MAVPHSQSACRNGVYLRWFQIALSITLLVLSSVCLGSRRTIYSAVPAVNIVTSVFGIFWYTLLLVPTIVTKLRAAVILGFEIWLVIWWIISLTLSAMGYRYTFCYIYGSIFSLQNGCRSGKGMIAVTAIGLVGSLVTLFLLSFFGINPIVSKSANRQMLTPNAFAVGGLYLLPDVEIAQSGDLEKGVVAPGEEDAVSREPVGVPVDAPTHTSPSIESVRETEVRDETAS